LLSVAAPVAALAALLVFTAAAVTAVRIASAPAVATAPAPPAAATTELAAAASGTARSPRASVEMGTGSVRPAVVDAAAVEQVAAAVELDFTAAPSPAPRRGRLVRHGPAVVSRDTPAARPLLRPTLDIDPTAFLP